MGPRPLTYVLPIRAEPDDPFDDDLDRYLAQLVGWVDDVVVVDGSDADRFDAHARRWPPGIRHLHPTRRTRMGKVGGVLTGIGAAAHDTVVLADDDVRWRPEQLDHILELLTRAEVVRPQNAYRPAPWHARWDTGRILVHRAVGGDWPGTLALRRAALPDGGYAGDALFENLELVRTVRAAGGRSTLALDLVVERRPSTTSRFVEQRVRQAYDEWARPGHLAVELALAPLVAVGGRRAALAVALAAVGLAEVGRRRGGGRRVWPWTASWWAPLWVAERSVTSWLAVVARVRGGVRYRDGRLLLAAHSEADLRRQYCAHGDGGGGGVGRARVDVRA